MKVYEFNNKFEYTNKWVVASLLIRLLLIITAFILIAIFDLGGTKVLAVFFAVVIISTFLRTKDNPISYETVPTTITFHKDRLEISYKALDRHDKLGVREEHYCIYADAIEEIEYSKKSGRITIVSKAMVKIIGNNETVELDYRQSGGFCKNILLFEEDIKKELFLKDLQEFCRNATDLDKQ